MAIVLETTATFSDGSADTIITVTKPSAAVETDVLVAWMECSSTASHSAPGGTSWVQVDQSNINNRNHSLWYLVLGAGEPSDWTFTLSASQGGRYSWCGRFSGVDNSTPSDATNSSDNATSQTTFTSSSITTGNANAYIIQTCILNGSASQSSSDLAEILDTGGRIINGEIQTAAGASGTKDGNYSTTRHYNVFMWALKEAGAAAAGATPIPDHAGLFRKRAAIKRF